MSELFALVALLLLGEEVEGGWWGGSGRNCVICSTQNSLLRFNNEKVMEWGGKL